MGKKSGPAAPAAPDPYATAAAQSQVNQQAAVAQANLNRLNQVTPQGNLTYTMSGTNPDGTPQYTQTQSYSTAEQQKYDQQNQVASALNGIAISNIDRVRQAQATPFSYDGMTPLQTAPQAGGVSSYVQPGAIRDNVQTYGVRNSAGVGDVAYSSGGVGDARYNVDARDVQTGAAGAGTAQGLNPMAGVAGLQTGLDYSGLTRLPGVNDFGAEGARMSDSVYAQAASRLDPRFKQAGDDQQARLAAMGITENSDAYRREQDNLSRDRNDAYNQAAYQAVTAGADEQSRLFGLSMNARQQGQNEVNSQGQFNNAAQAQGFGQVLDAYNQNIGVQGQNFGQNFQNASMYNDAQQQRFGQEAQSLQMYNAANQQQYDQRMGQAQLYNAANQQQYAQRANEANLYNTANQQLFGQGAYAADFYNQAQAQRFGQGMDNANLYNSSQQQVYNQSAASAAFNNQARQQQIQEAAYQRNLPLNDIAALLNGNSPQGPQFSSYANVGVAAPDYQGQVNNNYQSQMNQYNQQQASRSQMLGSIFGTLGTVAAFSDIRLKEEIKRIGTLPNGLATYAFKYIGDKAQRFGVMAQEVLGVVPDAVGYDKHGFMYVDYGKVY